MALARKLTAKIYEIQAHTQKVTSLDLGETGRVLVTGGQDRNVNLWAFGNEECFMSLTGHNGQVDCVKFASGDDIVYSADENGIIKRWDLNAQPGCVTFYGHMKSVRTLDIHPHGEYIIASGSNDTTVRLWDVRKGDSCIEKYRGHIANVNSVKFSPDGYWIASAGTEGSVIIWDTRTRKKIIEFVEHASPVTCITFHPFEFLLAAGRNDGTVDLYDLEKTKLISRTDSTSPFNGHTVKCITFSENGECCFVGSAEGISVIGWEPDKEFDHIESAWSILGDMKVINRKLICGSYEKDLVMINAINLDHVIPFYNPSNIPFSYNQSTRKSFSRGAPKIKLSLKSLTDNNNEQTNSLGSKDISSPSSFEMIDETFEDTALAITPSSTDYTFDKYARNRESYLYSLPPGDFTNLMPDATPISNSDADDNYIENYTNDLDFYPMKSSPAMNNVVEPEREDFPVNSVQLPNYAPKMDLVTPQSKINKTKSNVPRKSSITGNGSRLLSQSRKLSSSTIDLHSTMSDATTTSTSNYGLTRKGFSRNGSPTRNYSANNNNNTSVANKQTRRGEVTRSETNHARKNRNITVQIMTKPPPTRSKTSFDLRASSVQSNHSLPPSASSTMIQTVTSVQAMPVQVASTTVRNTSQYHHNGMISSTAANEENSEIQHLTMEHERLYQELSNRYAMIQMIRTKSPDILSALRHIVRIRDHSVLVDLLGAILEKPASWNLDMCTILLPEIYDLLQGNQKFHFTRACDTLRIIITSFLPIIQSNIDPWGRPYNGVDVTREERQKKCMECAHWLSRIKTLPDNKHMGSNLTQLQNLIVDI